MKHDLRVIRPYLLLVILSLIIYLPISLHASYASFWNSDYGPHIEMALDLPATVPRVTHVLYHAVILLLHRLLPAVALTTLAAIASVIYMLPVPLIAFLIFKRAANGMLPNSLLMAFSLCLTILTPVTIWTNPHMIGYFNPIVYHNPTTIALRLFLIPVSLLAVRIFQVQSISTRNNQIYTATLCAVLVLLATLAKPSYTLVVVPVCCLFATWRLLRRRYVDLPFLAFGICLPGLLILGLLYLLAYYNFDDGSTIAIGFFTFMKAQIPTWRIPLQLMLSLVFPMGLYLCFRRQARQDLYLNLSWLTFGVGAAMAYLLYEAGPRFGHGNFLWGGYSAIFVLVFASMLFFCGTYAANRQRHGEGNLQLLGVSFTNREAFVLLLFGLHVVSGIAYYFRFLGTTTLP